MPKLIDFAKYQGSGNDFILIKDFDNAFCPMKVAALCHRSFGIGADGLILIKTSSIADFAMVYFNADGSRAAMCGNGLRCLGQFLFDEGHEKSVYNIQVQDKVFLIKRSASQVVTYFPLPTIVHWALSVPPFTLFVVNTSVVHAVIFAKEEVDVVKEGRRLRYDPLFNPEGVNVNFVRWQSQDMLSIATYERGVEAQTLCCATGAIAAAFVAHKLKYCVNKVDVIPPSQQKLEVCIQEEVEVKGPATKVFEGKIKR